MNPVISLLVVILFSTLGFFRDEPSLHILQSGTPTSIRGLSVVDEQVAWVSGSNGWVARTDDRGKTWQWMQVPGFEEVDFRDVEAFSAEEAVLLSAGSPLLILRTGMGGRHGRWPTRTIGRRCFLTEWTLD